MTIKRLEHFPHRIVFKLTVLILLLSIASGAGFYWFSSRELGNYIKRTLFPNLQQQVVYLIRDINQNPDPGYIYDLSRRLNMDIAISTANNFWSTNSEILPSHFEDINRKMRRSQHRKRRRDEDDEREHEHEWIPWHQLSRRHPDLATGRFFSVFIDGHHGISYKAPQSQIVIIYRSELTPFSDINYLKLLSWLIAITLLAFFILRHIMRPLKKLRQGVQDVEYGKFDTTLAHKGNDEFARLIQSFNKMTKSVREHIQQKEQLLFDMSHELRSPLARIRVAMEFLPKSRAKTMIGEDISEQEAIIEDLLESARLNNQNLVKEEVVISHLIQETINKQQFANITFTCSNKKMRVKVHKGQIARVITNLIDNAIKHSPDDCTIQVHCFARKKQVCISVADSGPGVPEQDRERIFEPFYRLDSSRTKSTGGFGLGLSLCKRILEAHQGHIFVDPEYSGGLKIVCTLPR